MQTLFLELEEPDRTYERGEEIVGVVRVRPTRRFEGTVPLHLEWFTDGKGDFAHEPLVTLTPFSGTLDAGESLSVPFSVEVPERAYPYEGGVFRVDHRIRAVLGASDVPAHRRTEATSDVSISPAPTPSSHRIAPYSHQSEEGSFGCLFQCLGIALVGALGIAAGAFAPALQPLAPLGAMTFIMASVFAFLIRPRAFAERKVGSVGFSIEPVGMRDFREAKTDLRCTLTTRAQLATASVQLTIREEARRYGGDSSRTFVRDLHNQEIELRETEAGRFEGTLVLPDAIEVPEPFQFGRSKVEWSVTVRLQTPGAPTWTHMHILERQH